MTVLIRFNTMSASPLGSYQPGQVAAVPEDFATPLLEGGYATLVGALESAPESPSGDQEPAGIEGDNEFTIDEESEGSGDDGELAAALGLADNGSTETSGVVVAGFGAAVAADPEETPGEGVASLTDGDLAKPTGRRRTGG